MATSLSISEKVEIVRLYSIYDGNAAQTRRMLYLKGLDEGKWKKIGVNRANIPCIQTLTKHSMKPVVAECQKINDDPAFLRKVCYSVTTRVEQCIAADGRAFKKYR